jgi:uncharacterized protein (TIGR02271 family)
MISRDSVQTLIGGTAYTNDGDKIGSIGQIYLDNASGEPAWVTVKTGLFGSNESFVPLDQAELTEDGVRVPYDKDRVKGAPNIETDRELSEQEEDRLYGYYGVGGKTDTAGYDTTSGEPTRYAGYDAGTAPGSNPTLTTSDATDTDATDRDVRGTDVADESRTTGYDTSGPTTDDAMTRSEERVRTGTEAREAGRARLRKYVTTEQQQVTVPVTREEVRVEREPITDENRDAAMSGQELSEEEHEVVLTEERPVVETEAVPVERVRLAKDQVEEDRMVNVDVRKEQIETEGDAVRGTGLRDDDARS